MYNFWVGMGNCFAKNKLPGCFKLREDQGDSIFYQRNPIFSHYVNLVALIPQSLTGGSPGPGSGARALVLGLLSHCCQGLKARGASQAMDIHTPTPCMHGPPPRGLHFHGKGTPRGSGGRSLQPRCSRVGQLLMGVPGEVEGLDHINLFSFTLLCGPPHPILNGIS